MSRLATHGLTLAYGRRQVMRDLDVEIPDRSFTVIIGANGCGKSTLLRALARVLKPAAGTVLLDGRAIGEYPSRHVARTIGLLPQSPITPDGITVAELVSRGRFPHQGALRRESEPDRVVIERCLAETGLTDLSQRPVATLSGGQRQRAWIAMALAQDTELLLLDEPTTYLDLAHQIEVLDLCARLHAAGRTVVAVLHDLNQAARYASHMIVLREGAVIAEGAPGDVITAKLVEQAFGLRARIIEDPETGTPLVIPLPTQVTAK
ncbi:ABC transporter ATP-binding protein [Actinospica sp.]|jgi:iron complex transport system ATP-binding protein|uniref:ABC transporter ATP-binding protein n=1 Tax=Actinospica sp. TaxID=1872142 RepID=UPI002CE024DF|nr:ABC transporter ATP-binding protein [Actinospica sp.]HWG25192.1 ABC transporter ATP-binding protein [Actinospica sp.]